MIETQERIHELEHTIPAPTESTAGAGLSDWKRAVNALGERSLATFIEAMDPGNAPDGVNAHRVIAERLENLRIPHQPHITATVEAFAEQPEQYFSQLRRGDYFFASIRPGIHLAHANSEEEVTLFVRNFVENASGQNDLQQELYLSRNGEPVLSGHIEVRDDNEPNSIYAEFTNGDFPSFHRGFRTPEILVRRNRHRLDWVFQGRLQPQDGDWRTEQQFACNGNVSLSRLEMARRIAQTIQLLPHDGDTYLPGYYEVLLERTDNTYTRPTFIEAVTAKTISAYL